MQPIGFGAASAALTAFAAGITTTTKLIRSWAAARFPRLPDYTWIIVAFAVGIVTATQTRMDVIGRLVPGLSGLTGEILTGALAGGIAAPIHHATAFLSAKTAAAAAAADPRRSVPVPPDAASGDELLAQTTPEAPADGTP